jgi:DNA-directed RNA polymerase subunit RPC12/RpoP
LKNTNERSEAMRFSCPSCSQPMQCPDDYAGKKAKCPKCAQKILVPTPPPTSPIDIPGFGQNSTNKTTLGKIDTSPYPQTPATPINIPEFEFDKVDEKPTPPPVPIAVPVSEVDVDHVDEFEFQPPKKVVRRRNRNDEYDDEDDEDDGRRNRRSRRQSSRREFTCPYCGTNHSPRVRQKISAAGWIVFIILLFFCFPLCIVGIFITEDFRECSSCGIKIGG